jgi:regulator of replication initiation timing
MSLSIRLANLKLKTEELTNKHHQVIEERNALKLEINELKSVIELQKNTIKDLEEQNKIAKIASSISDDGVNSKELKLKINEYIREIDKCIAMLNE